MFLATKVRASSADEVAKSVDQILVVRDGEIVERGTHTRLLADCAFYHELYTSQFQVDGDRPALVVAA